MAGMSRIYLARHGETEWSRTGQHTGRADLPLTEHGESEARTLGARLVALSFAHVFTSPLQRARRTCELAGFAGRAEVVPDMMEWDYGRYESRRAAEIRAERPDWELFRDGCPGGETAADVGARADRVIARVSALDGDAILFAHGHFLRVFTARWIGLPPDSARRFMLSTGALCAVGYEHGRAEAPAIALWNAV